MTDQRDDLKELLEAARDAIRVLRSRAENLEIQALDSSAERRALRRLDMALQVVEYDYFGPDEMSKNWDWRQS